MKVLVLFASTSLFCCLALGDEPLPGEKESSGWQKLFREQAAGYRIEAGESGEARMIPEPVLRWSHPVRGGEHGAVFLWLKKGLPVVIGTFNIWPLDDGRQRVAHELHSLSQVPLTAVWKGRKWTPPQDSLNWMPLDAAPYPKAGEKQRSRELRQLAEGFSARSRDRNANRKWELRLLPRPLYRYGSGTDNSQDRDVVDGAVFGFVEGTDLEVVLLLELRHAADGDQWWYAAARMSDFGLELTRAGRTVWQVGPGEYDKAAAPYYCATVETRTSPEAE